jgi:uncharacterized protein
MPAITPQDLLFMAVIFLAGFSQSLAGFGSALIAMSVLTPLMGLQIAAPLVAVLVLLLEVVLLAYYRQAFNLHNAWRLILASVVGVPLGVLFLKRIDADLMMAFLGLVIAGYAIYALLRFRLPALGGNLWGWGFGLLAGMLGGAYNTSGPPAIIYGNCRGWQPAEFKSNLQAFFLVNSTVVFASHLLAGSYNASIWRDALLGLPLLAAGVIAGLSLDRYINPEAFRKIVLGLLIILGLRLIF